KFLEENLKKIAVRNFKVSENNFKNLSFTISDSEISELTGDIFNYEIKRYSISGIVITIQNVGEKLKISFEPTDSFQYLSKDIEIEDIYKILAQELSKNVISLPKVFYFPAERTGINVFKNELNESRLKTYDTLLNTVQFTNLTNQKKKAALKYDLLKKNIELLMETTDNSSYPKPISDYINYLNNMKNRYEQKNVNNIASYIRDEIIMGKYEIDEKDNSVSFRQKFGKNRYRKERIPFHVVSSSIKSLYGLDYYLENSSKEGDYLIIDEPELSLHPENQVKLAKVITDIVESKIKLITSTHSDLFVRELTNIVIENKLNSKNNKKNKLSDKNIGIYNFVGNNDINELEKISNISYYDNFDDVNYDLQERYNDLIEELEERGE
ncbi:TPA: ATP-binding protein, partial [Enterococcus faecium]|nr:ATP-binding protein [Enterococcus faecium]